MGWTATTKEGKKLNGQDSIIPIVKKHKIIKLKLVFAKKEIEIDIPDNCQPTYFVKYRQVLGGQPNIIFKAIGYGNEKEERYWKIYRNGQTESGITEPKHMHHLNHGNFN